MPVALDTSVVNVGSPDTLVNEKINGRIDGNGGANADPNASLAENWGPRTAGEV